MTVQPKYHWQFKEEDGHIVRDTISKSEGKFFKTSLNGYGRIGEAVLLEGLDSRVTLDKEVGQFGTIDFTVAFGIKILNIFNQNDTDIIGNRNVSGHGNWFSLRLEDKGRVLNFEVDESSKGKNFTQAKTSRLSNLSNNQWHHIAIVRAGRSVKIYFDGVQVAKRDSKTGIANINGSVAAKLGHYTRHTPIAQYEDLRVYYTALNASEIRALIPPANRPLKEGEIELVATDDATVILKQDVADLSLLSNSFKQLRVGTHTGVTLYSRKNFKGISQKCHADLPDMQLSKIESFPKALRIWSAVGDPFTGTWVIKAPNGEFLSQTKSALSTAPQRSFQELFRFHYNLRHGQLQLLPGFFLTGASHKLSPLDKPTLLFVEELENRSDEFFITNDTKNQWLELGEDGIFKWTVQEENRALFTRVAKRAVDESQVGELAMGEVALYKHRAYYGSAWILSDSEKDQSGNYKRLTDFQDLNDQTSSIRLGPNTGVTLFRNIDFKAAEDKREEQIEDIVENAPRLYDLQIGNDNLSSIRIFRTISPEDVFTSFSTKLSQDYRLVDNKLQEFSSYRTILKFEPGAGEIEVSATDLTEIEVEGSTHEIDERRSMTLKPNELNSIMITSEADGLNTPGLKIRTSEMEANERVVIFPDEEAHQQVAALEDGALWNAKDAKGNLIVDRNAHSQEEVASVQNTIKRVMGTVSYAGDQTAQRTPPSNSSSNAPSTLQPVSVPRPVLRRGGSVNVRAAVQGSVSQAVSADTNSRVQLSNRVVSGATIDKPWSLELPSKNRSNLQQIRAIDAVDGTARSANSLATKIIQEVEISQDEFARLLSQAIPEETNAPQQTVNLPPGFSAIRIGNPFKRVGRAIKKATSVVVGVVKDVVNVVVKTAEGVFKFVIDTVEKVAEFVESVVEKVVESIKQFIEFLQFLFDWDDILDTQRYLVSAVNSGFDFATQAAKDSKPLVSAFVGNLQSTVEDGMNKLPELLGANPSEVEESDFEMPEAFEWFISKLLGGSKQSDAKPATNSGKNPSEDSALESFFSNFLEALENAIGAGLIVSEGLIESIQKLIENPQQPQFALIEIIEALRDAIIQSLSAVENIALGLLDVVGEAIQQLKNLLNAEIKIPFISDLFKLIGAGKLTTLNLSTLLLAIPVTVISKITTNEKPFTGALPLEPSTKNQTRQVALTDTETQSDDNKPSQTSNNDNEITELRRSIAFTTITTVADTVNHIINVPLDLIPTGVPVSPLFGTFELASLALGAVSWGFSVPFDRSLTFKQDDLGASMETLLWTYRGGLLGADIITMIVGALQFGGTRRMRRLNQATIVVWGVLSTIDLGLAITYLAIADEDLSVGIPSEIVAWIPNIAALSRLSGDPLIPLAVQGIANITAVVFTPILGLVAIIKDAQALSRALKAA